MSISIQGPIQATQTANSKPSNGINNKSATASEAIQRIQNLTTAVTSRTPSSDLMYAANQFLAA